MARTTPAKVEGILNRDYDYVNRPDLAPYIETANDLVTRTVTAASTNGLTISTTTAELIERWLAADCYVRSDSTHSSRSNAGASASFTRKGDEYRKMAVALDPSGILLTLLTEGKQRVDIFWLGKQIPYQDRN
jgi:hypothetical protein